MDAKEQAIMLLASTQMGTGEIAAMLGVSPSYISQLKADKDVMEEVAARKTIGTLAEIKRDERKDRIEDILLEKLENAATLIFNPKDLLMAIRTVDGLQRRSRAKEAPPQVLGEGQTIVNVVLPKHLSEVTVQVKVNTNNDIVEVGGRAMINMGAVQVMEKMQEQAAARATELLSSPKTKTQEIIDQF